MESWSKEQRSIIIHIKIEQQNIIVTKLAKKVQTR